MSLTPKRKKINTLHSMSEGFQKGSVVSNSGHHSY